MNQPNSLPDDPFAHRAPDELPIDRPRSSGFVLQKIDVPAALEVLDSFLEEDDGEQRETFEYLKRALTAVSANPWLEVHGSLRDDPTYEDFMTEISATAERP